MYNHPDFATLDKKTFVETTKYKLIYVYTIEDKKHEGYLKVGDTDVVSSLAPDQLAPNCKALNDAARARIDQQTQTAGVEYQLLYTELAVRSFRDEYLLELVNLDNVDARGDQDVDERVLSKTLVADVEKTIQALGGDDFFTRLSLRSSRASGASWRMRGPNPSRSRKGNLHLARLQREARDDISPAIGRAFDG